MTPEQMAAEAAIAIAGGTGMTLVRPRGMKMPPKFPRGELLCENYDGRHVYSYDPLKVLAWLSAARQAPSGDAFGRSGALLGSAADCHSSDLHVA